jgi:hypothetical protein
MDVSSARAHPCHERAASIRNDSTPARTGSLLGSMAMGTHRGSLNVCLLVASTLLPAGCGTSAAASEFKSCVPFGSGATSVPCPAAESMAPQSAAPGVGDSLRRRPGVTLDMDMNAFLNEPDPSRELLIASSADCRGTITQWGRWTGSCERVLADARVRPPLLLALAWRLWFDWISPEIEKRRDDAIADVLRQQVYRGPTPPTANERRLNAESIGVFRLHAILALSAMRAQQAIHAHLSSVMTTAPSCREQFVQQRDTYAEAARGYLEEARQRLQRYAMDLPNPQRTDLGRYVDALLEVGGPTAWVTARDPHRDQTACRLLRVSCLALLSRGVDEQTSRTCDQASRCPGGTSSDQSFDPLRQVFSPRPPQSCADVLNVQYRAEGH